MRIINVAGSQPGLAIAFLLVAPVASSLSATSLAIPGDSLAAAKSGNDLILSFSTTSPDFYTLQTCQDFLQGWTNFQAGVPGDGTVKAVAIPNANSGGERFYRLLIQAPTKLLLPQSIAFSILGYWCGGIQEKVYVTGFDPIDGYSAGVVLLSTTCSGSGRGGHSITHRAWAAATWDFAGNVISTTALTNGATVSTKLTATDKYGDVIYNVNAAAYLVIPLPAAPTGVTALQSGDEFQVSWTPNGVNPAAVTSSRLTATPVNSTAPILTTTAAGPATGGVIPTLQPQTTYEITVVNSTISGSSPVSIPIRVTTVPASVPPAAPTGVTASWANLDPAGATDTILASWQAAFPGDSPIDEYRITIVGSDGAGTFTQTVAGTILTASFTVDYTPNWSVTVQAHNAIGWGPSSNVFMLGGL